MSILSNNDKRLVHDYASTSMLLGWKEVNPAKVSWEVETHAGINLGNGFYASNSDITKAVAVCGHYFNVNGTVNLAEWTSVVNSNTGLIFANEGDTIATCTKAGNYRVVFTYSIDKTVTHADFNKGIRCHIVVNGVEVSNDLIEYQFGARRGSYSHTFDFNVGDTVRAYFYRGYGTGRIDGNEYPMSYTINIYDENGKSVCVKNKYTSLEN